MEGSILSNVKKIKIATIKTHEKKLKNLSKTRTLLFA